jgi:hypothetical protein
MQASGVIDSGHQSGPTVSRGRSAQADHHGPFGTHRASRGRHELPSSVRGGLDWIVSSGPTHQGETRCRGQLHNSKALTLTPTRLCRSTERASNIRLEHFGAPCCTCVEQTFAPIRKRR